MARKRLTALPDGLWIKLAELDRYVQQLDLVRGLGWTLAIAAICVGGGLLADMTFDLPLLFRVGLLAFAICVTLGMLVGMIWHPWRRQRSDVDLAALVEKAHPELKESLVSCIELYDASIPESERGSELMRELSAKQALQKAASLDFCDSVSPSPAHRMAVGGLLAWALLLLPLMMPTSYRLLFARFLAPWQNLDRVTSFWFDVEQGDRVVVRGSDVTLTAHPRGAERDIPETASLNWMDAQGESDSRRVDFDTTKKVYSTTIPHVMQDFEYYLTGAGNRSRTYRIRVVEAPAITGIKLQIQPPAYTGQPAKMLDGPSGEIEVLEQSRLSWKLTFNKPMQSAEWQWLSPQETPSANPVVHAIEVAPAEKSDAAVEKIPLKLSADRLSAAWETVAERSGPFRLVVRDEHGLTNESDTSRHLTVTPDSAPILNLSGDSDTETAQATDIIPVDVEAIDDVGLGALELHFEIDATRQVVVKCDPRELIGTKVEHRFNLELSTLHAKDGELVTYRVRAADERPVPGPNETWSERRLIRIDSSAKAPGTQQLAAEQGQLQEFLKQLKLDVTALKEQAAELQADAAEAAKDPASEDQEAAAEAQQKLEDAADQQAQLQARLEQLTAAFGQHPLFANLTQRTQQLSEQEFAQAQKALSDAEQAQTPEKAEKLQTAKEQLTQAGEKLGQLERQFDKLAQLERDLLELNRLAANAEQLAQRLRDFDRRQNEPPPANETAQERETREQVQKAEEQRLADQQLELAQQAEDLLKRQPELEQAARQNLTQQLSQLSQQAAELAKPQQALANELQEAANEVAQSNEALAERHAELQKQAEELNEQLAKQDNPRVKPIDPEQLAKALEELQAGNLGAAAEEEERLAKKLDELEEELRKAEQLAKNSPPKKNSDMQAAAERAQKLADQQAAAAKAAQQAADQKAAPSEEQQQESAEQLAEVKEELTKLKPQQAQAEQKAAEAALDQAASKQQELAQQANDPESAPGQPKEPELERLLKENAEAQQEAAESLQQLADRLKKPAADQPQKPGEEVAAADPSAKLSSPDPAKQTPTSPNVGDAGQEEPSAQPNPVAEQARQLAQEARELQQQLEQAQQNQDLKSPQEQQQKLTESLQQLNEQIEQAREKLQKSKPAPGKSQNQQSPEEPANQQAQQAMEQAARELEQGNLEKSAAAGQQAAEALQESSQGSPMDDSPMDAPPAGQSPPDQPRDQSNAGEQKSSSESSLPPETAGQVAEAVQQLQEALSAPPPSRPSSQSDQPPASSENVESAANAKSTPDERPIESQPGEGPAGSQPPSGNPSPLPGSQPSEDSNSPSPGSNPGKSGESSSGQSPNSEGSNTSSTQPGPSKNGPPTAGANQPGSPSGPQPGGQPSGATASESSSAPTSAKSATAQSSLQSAAQRLKQAAESLRQASSQVQSQNAGQAPGQGQGTANSPSQPGKNGNPQPGQPNGQPGQGLAQGGQGAPGVQNGADGIPGPEATVNVDANLERLKKRLAGRKWGELPGKLQTEILQAAQKKPNSEYAELIRQYFKEIAKTQPVPK